MTAYNMRQIGPRLDMAGNLLERGDKPNAQANYSTAKQSWDAIHKDFKGQFDVNHPDIVAMQKRFDTIEAELKGGAPKPDPTPVPPPTDPAGQAPSAAMVYAMKQIDGNLDRAEKALEIMDIKSAQQSFWNAEKYWAAQQKDYRGKYDSAHPSVIALNDKYLRIKAKIEGLETKSTQANENLPAVLAAISDSQEKIAAADQKARESARSVSSLMSDYDSGREQNVDKLRLKVEELRERSEVVNALLPDAHAAAAAFRKQYPDFTELQKLVKDGWQATQAVEQLEKFPSYWLDEGCRLIDEALTRADGCIKQFSLARFKDLEGKDQAIQINTADSADFYVVELSTFLLDIVPSILPE